jgi:hypothetical protein
MLRSPMKQADCWVDFVGHYETLAQDFAHVCHQLGIAAALPHLNRSTHHEYRADYTARSWQLVAEHFATDIQLFGYTADLLVPVSTPEGLTVRRFVEIKELYAANPVTVQRTDRRDRHGLPFSWGR